MRVSIPTFNFRRRRWIYHDHDPCFFRALFERCFTIQDLEILSTFLRKKKQGKKFFIVVVGYLFALRWWSLFCKPFSFFVLEHSSFLEDVNLCSFLNYFFISSPGLADDKHRVRLWIQLNVIEPLASQQPLHECSVFLFCLAWQTTRSLIETLVFQLPV